jgi:phosphatidylserine/phosphatidylglycerophosphate/cardiolipin synthase-like enzyme
MVTASKNGLAVRGIMDQSAVGYQPYSDLSNQLGGNLQIYAGLPGYDNNSICHSKYMIIDPCDLNADPMVFTGSHNWSASANTNNDENTVIVHDSSIANQYYQAFHSDFEAVSSGTNLSQVCIPLGIEPLRNIDKVTFYPNPANSSLRITYTMPGNTVRYMIYNATGQLLLSGNLDARYVNTVDINSLSSGMYLLRVTNNNEEFTGKFIKQ